MYFDKRCVICGAAALFLLLLSILCRLITGVILKKLAADAENLSVTQNLLLRQCKLKFQNYYELNDGNMNVEIFVEKFLQGIRVGKCSLRVLNLLSGQLLLMAVLLCGIAACISLVEGRTLGEILPYYLLAFGGLYIFFAVSGLVDTQGKLEILKTTMVDFFENRMGERIKNVKKDNAYLDELDARISVPADRQERGCGQNAECTETVDDNMPDGEQLVKNTELEALLSEFLA